jgi:hypothetical protein
VRIEGIDNLIDTFTSGNNTRYTFTQPGYYSLAMWGHDSTGNFIGFDGPDVYAYGRYEIKSSSDTLCPNEEVTFENKFYDGTHYFWDFGDGDTVTDYKVKHVYASKGEQ